MTGEVSMQDAKIGNIDNLVEYLVWADKNVEDAFCADVAGVIIEVYNTCSPGICNRFMEYLRDYDRETSIQDNLKISETGIKIEYLREKQWADCWKRDIDYETIANQYLNDK